MLRKATDFANDGIRAFVQTTGPVLSHIQLIFAPLWTSTFYNSLIGRALSGKGGWHLTREARRAVARVSIK